MSGPLELMEAWLRKGRKWADNAAVAILYPHYETHKGNTHGTMGLISGVADGEQFNLLFWNPEGDKEAHVFIEVSCGGRGFAYLYEGTEIQATGTFAGSTRLNRRIDLEASRDLAEWTAAYGVAVDTLGDQIARRFIPGSDGANPNAARASGSIRPGLEWILCPTQNYLIVVHNDSGATVPASIVIEFYEEDSDEFGTG